MNTKAVADLYGVNQSTARNWAAKNGVGRTIKGGILAFEWTEKDCQRFTERRGKGWEKGRSRK